MRFSNIWRNVVANLLGICWSRPVRIRTVKQSRKHFCAIAIWCATLALVPLPFALGQSNVVIESSGIDIELLKNLRSQGVNPIFRDGDALRKLLTELEASGDLSVELRTEVEKASTIPPSEASVLGVGTLVESLELDHQPLSFFDALSEQLSDEQYVRILASSSWMELPSLPTSDALPSDILVSPAVSEMQNLPFNPQGQVVQGETLPASVGTREQIAATPGLGGLTTTKESLHSCSEYSTRFNRGYDQYVAGKLEGSALTEFLSLALEVSAHCFFEPMTPLPKALTAVGVLSYPPHSPASIRCAALLVGPSEIVTARHCLYLQQDGSKPLFSEPGSIWFLPLAAPARAIPLKQMFLPRNDTANEDAQFSPEWDVARASLSEPVLGGPTICWASPVAKGRALALAGPILPLPVPLQEHSNAAAWSSKVRLATGGTCLTGRVGNRCFEHFCNSLPGFSGAPVFAVDQSSCLNGVAVLGIHLAAFSTASSCPTLAGNVAIGGDRVSGLLW